MARRSVRFTTESPHIIQENEKKVSMVPPVNKNAEDFSGGDRQHRVIMIAKLFAIYAIPVVILLIQSGTFLSREIKTRHLTIQTREGILDVINLGQTRDHVSVRGGSSTCTNTTHSGLETGEKDNFKVTVRDAIVGADEDGELWKYFIMYEILIRASNIIDHQICLTSSFVETDNISAEDIDAYDENRSSLKILFQLGSQRLDQKSLRNNSFTVAVQKFAELLNACDTFVKYNDSLTFSNYIQHERLNQTRNEMLLITIIAQLRDLENWIESDVATELLKKQDIQVFLILELNKEKDDETLISDAGNSFTHFHRVESYYQFGIGILIASAIVCPLLAFLYIRSMNTMSTLIKGYAAHMVVKSAEVSYEKKHTERILHQMLPPMVANALVQQKEQKPETYESVTVFFSDIEGFGDLVEESKPLQIVDWLNAIYFVIDNEIEKVDAYKVETIGDAYMVVSGLPQRNGDMHAGELSSFSLRLMQLVPFQASQLAGYPKKAISLRIGLHSGPCVAGVIGTKMPRYCLFGDTVNTASRMKSYGEALRIHISNSTKEVLDKLGNYFCICRGELAIKGKGAMITWWLNGKCGDDFNVELFRNQFLCDDNE